MKIKLNRYFSSSLYTERQGRVVNTSASYLGGLGFNSGLGDKLSLLKYVVVFLSPSRLIPG
jgi:hypothetical protein